MMRPIHDEDERGDLSQAQTVETRLLTPEEIACYVKPIYDERHYALPNPANSVFVGVVHAGEVVAFLGLQLMLHAEPLWIKDGEANRLLGLVHAAERIILERTGPQWVYLHAPPGKVARMAEVLGMTLEPYCIYSKLVMPSAPPRPLSSLAEGEEVYDEVIQ